MNQASGNWADLKPRVLTGIAMAAVGAFAVWAGGVWFLGLVSLASGLMFWELARISRADDWHLAVLFGLAATIGVAVLSVFPQIQAAWTVVLLIATLSYSARRLQYSVIVYGGAVIIAPLLLIGLRNGPGTAWVLWILLVVIASDIAGYLAGRTFGGPKFWPKISPKKTWSGTVAGWISAAIVGFIMAPYLGVGMVLVPISAVLAFAGQMGDIAESALKRKAGIKDSSNLLPGHGGVLDRLDALVGASIGLFVIMAVFGFGP